jgi:hypothetical protein
MFTPERRSAICKGTPSVSSADPAGQEDTAGRPAGAAAADPVELPSRRARDLRFEEWLPAVKVPERSGIPAGRASAVSKGNVPGSCEVFPVQWSEAGKVPSGDPIGIRGGKNGSPCIDACDANDDGKVDLADAVSILRYLFTVGGKEPAAPFPDPGADPTADRLGCIAGEVCR